MSRPAREFLELSAAAKISHHVRNGQLDQRLGDKAPGGWRASPELPLPKELMATEPSPLLVNRVDTPPRSKAEYLETHYRLYRCEGVEPLRQAISEFRESPHMMEGDNSFIYTKVHVQGYLFSKLGASCRVAFSTERSPTKIAWRQSGRLTPGTLVALSTDAFRTQCFVATVASRALVGGLEPDVEAGEDSKTPPRVDISWADKANASFDPAVEMTMLEASSGYFENVRHAMVGLQYAALYESSLEDYILGTIFEIRPAGYLRGLPSAIIPEAATHFDQSQLQAFEAMTSQELAIVQGPPGTGKTFTSIVALQSCVETLKCKGAGEATPIIISAQTNHALDQLLQLCLQYDIKIARLGGQSRSEAVDEFSVFNLRQRSKAKRGDLKAEATREKLCRHLQELFDFFQDGLLSADDLFNRGLITQSQCESLTDNKWEAASTGSSNSAIASWLDESFQVEPAIVYQPLQGHGQGQDEPLSLNEHADQQHRIPDEEDKYRLKGLFIPIKPNCTGFIPGSLRGNGAWWHQAERYLSTYSDLYEIKPTERGIVYRYLRSKTMDQVALEIQQLFRQYQEVCDALKVSRWGNYLRVLQYEGIHVVGCTTTGLTKYRGLLAAMMPQIMLIEEAAETREANITSALLPSLEQLILVGDHQQLTPHVNVRHLGAPPYNLNVSLFERLVKLLPFNALRVQRRMVPTIRKIVQTFYPVLEDHAIVTQARYRPPVPGMGDHNLWWFEHQWPESRNDTHSCLNLTEADMIVGFVKYLVQNGLKPSQITILTYYNAQLDLIQRKLRKDLGRIEVEWSVRTVDGFQGEENDVILLSLVRSPASAYSPAVAGFVENENRAVVATSRARRGLYIFGNARNLLESSDKSNQTWQKVYSAFGEKTGCNLPVTCKSHGNVTELGSPQDWKAVSAGGCDKRCGKKCPNGHRCLATCHAADQEHYNTCGSPCSKALVCGHPCVALCRADCKCANRCGIPTKFTVKALTSRVSPLRAPPSAHKPERRMPRRRTSTSAVSSHSSKTGANTPTTGSPSEVGAHMTSDDLIEMGFLNYINMTAGGLLNETRRTVINGQAAQLSLRPLRTPSPETLPEKWSAEIVRQKETEVQQALRSKRSQSSTTSSIWDIHRPTTVAAGSRIVGSPKRTGILIDFTEDHGDEEQQQTAHSKAEVDLIQFD